MKTENFDDAIKRKIEGISHQVTDKDVARVQHYVNANRGPLWFRAPFRRLMVFSMLGLVLTALVTWQMTKMHDREILKQTVETLTKDQQKNNVATPDIKTTPQVNERTGQNNATGSGPASNSSSAGTNNDDHTIYNNSSRNITTGSANQNSNKQINPYSLSGKAYQSPNTETRKINRSSQNKNSNVNSGKVIGIDETDGSKTIAQENKTPDTDKGLTPDKTVADHLSENKGNTPDLALLPKKDTATDVIKQKPVAELKKPDTVAGPGSGYRNAKNNKKATYNPLNWQVQAGLGLQLGRYQAGANLTAQLLLNGRFGLISGIKMMNLASQTFEDDNDFNNKCGKEFNRDELHHQPDNHYPPPMQKHYKQIGVQNQLIQVPVLLSFNVPLKNGFGISVSAGTDLDVYSRQNLAFTVQDPMGHTDDFPNTQENINKPVLFNNATFSLGLQKQWGRFTAQLGPYFTTQLVATDYKLQSNYYGGNLKLMYSIFQ